MDAYKSVARLLFFLWVTLATPLVLAADPGTASININTADAALLAEGLTGVGESKAEAIVAHRDRQGPFRSADDLKQIKGIGDAIVEANRERITIE